MGRRKGFWSFTTPARSSERIRKRKAPSQLCVGVCCDGVQILPPPSFDLDAVPTYDDEAIQTVKGDDQDQ